MSEMDVLFPLPDGRRNADDMGMPPEQAMSDDLLRRLDEWGAAKRLEYLPSLGRQAAARIRELEAERDAVQHLFAQHERHRDELLAENERLRALLLKSYCYVAAHMPIGVKTDNDRKVLMLDLDAALKETP